MSRMRRWTERPRTSVGRAGGSPGPWWRTPSGQRHSSPCRWCTALAELGRRHTAEAVTCWCPGLHTAGCSRPICSITHGSVLFQTEITNHSRNGQLLLITAHSIWHFSFRNCGEHERNWCVACTNCTNLNFPRPELTKSFLVPPNNWSRIPFLMSTFS